MNSSKVRAMVMGMVAGLCSTGLMQAGERATFHLPVTAHWGLAVLKAGDYTMAFPENSLGQMNFSIAGAGKTVFEFPKVTTVDGRLRASYLKLTEIDGSYFISEFSSASAGKSFRFFVPKKKQSQQLAKTEESSIPVYGN